VDVLEAVALARGLKLKARKLAFIMLDLVGAEREFCEKDNGGLGYCPFRRVLTNFTTKAHDLVGSARNG
jgi:hypothetical protein